MVIRTSVQRRARALSFCILSAAAGGLSACNDPLGFAASISTLTDTFKLFAMSGTPNSVPVALSTTDRIAVRMADNLSFDVAFDIDPSGNVQAFPIRQVLPFRVLAGLLQATQRVGLQKSTTAFDNLTRAPSGGYNYDSATVVRVGETLIVEVQASQCTFSISPNLYTKIVIDSVSTASRSISMRTVHDPNCGFRSFKPGIPKD